MAIEPKTDTSIRCDTINSQTTPGTSIAASGVKFTGMGLGTLTTDSIRLDQVQNSSVIWCGTTAGAGNTYTCSASPAITAYASGQVVRFLSDKTNFFAATLNINGVGAAGLKDSKGVALPSGALQTGVAYEAIYDGSNFRLLSTKPVQISMSEGTTTISTTTSADYTGASITLTTNAGDIVEVVAEINISASTGGSAARAYMWVSEDASDPSTNYRSAWVNPRNDTAGQDTRLVFHKIFLPSAGSHTYKIRWSGASTTYSTGYRFIVKVTPAS